MKKTIAELKAEIRELENSTMYEVVDVLKRAGKPMTAEEMSASVGRVMSARQIQSNLVNIGQYSNGRKSYFGGRSVKKSRLEAIANEDGKLNTEVKTTTRRFAEIDENGQPIVNGAVIEREQKTTYFALDSRW